MQRISIVRSYRHLGGQLHHTSDQNTEVKVKIATAHQAFNQHRRLLYHNEYVSLDKKTEIFNTLVVTKVLYGADSWVAHDARTMHKFATAVLKLYKRLLGWKHDGHHTAQEILAAVKQPAPEILLRRARLRYLTTLFQCGIPDIWHLIGEDTHWIGLVEEDMQWMWNQLHHSSALKDPRHHVQQWYDLLIHHPRYWKRLLNRACYHDILQRCKHQQVVALHARVFQRFQIQWPTWTTDTDALRDPDEDDEEAQTAYGCMRCRIKCKNRAGEGAHMFKKHQQTSVYRNFIDQTQCSVCMKEMHTFSKMKAHLYIRQAADKP